MKKNLVHIALLALVGLALSCKNETKITEDTTSPTQTSTDSIVKDENQFEVTLESNDQMMYNLKEIKVPVGKPIVLTLKHTGNMSKAVMGHNFVLLNQGVDMEAFAVKAAGAKDTEYIPTDAQTDIIAYTKLIGGGESTTVTFTIDKAGTYDFLCSFPAHHALMSGKLIAE